MSISGYQKALEAAGATVLAFKSFGSYQGDWWAKVSYEGETFWVKGCYGSCSGCDAFEAEFGYSEGECQDHQYYGAQDGCRGCEEATKTYTQRLADFGLSYLDDPLTQEQAIAKASENLSWDTEANDMVLFLRNNAL